MLYKNCSLFLGGSTGLVVMGDDSCQEFVGSNPSAVNYMDIFSHWFVVKIVLFVWKDENKQKEAGVGPFF